MQFPADPFIRPTIFDPGYDKLFMAFDKPFEFGFLRVELYETIFMYKTGDCLSVNLQEPVYITDTPALIAV